MEFPDRNYCVLKIPLFTYSLSGRDTTKWVNRMLRSIGEAPVLYDSLQTQLSVNNLQAQIQNMGYLRASVHAENNILCAPRANLFYPSRRL